MANDHSILRAWHDLIVYEETAERRIEFDCPSLVEPPQITVPAAELWAAKVPAWAADRRDLIVQRLRVPNALVFERGITQTSVQSPDGTFRVDMISEPDDRAAPWETTRVVNLPGEHVVLDLPLYAATSYELKFASPGVVVLPLTGRYGAKHLIWLHVVNETFASLPDGPEKPLPEILALLQLTVPKAQLWYARTEKRAPFRRVYRVLEIVGCLIFVLGGIFMAFTAQATKDRWIGAAGALFFGFCGWASWSSENYSPARSRQYTDHEMDR